MKIKKRKIKYQTRKHFGWPEDSWARLGGPNGKKRSYGHYLGNAGAGWRSRAEVRNADDLRRNDLDELDS